MKILLAKEAKQADAFTIAQEAIESQDLMGRAAGAAAFKLMDLWPKPMRFYILCGMGNNGGDGLAIAQILRKHGRGVRVWVVKHTRDFSPEAKHYSLKVNFDWIESAADLPEAETDECVVDAILGLGQSRPVSGLMLDVVKRVNNWPNEVVAIDVPTGLLPDAMGEFGEVLMARHTLSFQFPKLGFFLPAQGWATQSFEVLDIGLDKTFISQSASPFEFYGADELKHRVIKRLRFSHKGNYGHVLLLAGSLGMAGAARLCAEAALRAGAGKLSLLSDVEVQQSIQTALPEAMCVQESKLDHYSISDYTLVAGPGLGRSEEQSKKLWKWLSRQTNPVVLDADALNNLADHPEQWKGIPPNSILTPHMGEFKRLFGFGCDSYEEVEAIRQWVMSEQLNLVMKGAYTAVFSVDGEVWFNSTGNAALAKGGSGDVLCGLIGGLLARHYEPKWAARMGVYLHGLSADLYVQKQHTETMLASDLFDYLPQAFRVLENQA